MNGAWRGVAFALALGVSSAHAAEQWRNVPRTDSVVGYVERTAEVQSAAGHDLRIFMADANRFVAVFALPDGLTALDPAGCPTFRVDDFAPEALHRPSGRCIVDGREVRIELARIADGKVESEVMLQLLNGSRLTVLYRLLGGGYRRAEFSLRGSKQALTTALPEGTQIVGD